MIVGCVGVVVCCSLFVVGRLLFVVCGLWVVVSCLSCIVCRLLLVVCGFLRVDV